MKTSGVYAIRNKVNYKIYVGSSVNAEKRTYEHFRRLGKGEHINKHLQASFAKYGADAFDWYMIEYYSGDDLLDVESRWIQGLNTTDPEHGYNTTDQTLAPMRGRKHSPETMAKIAATREANPWHHTPETIAQKKLFRHTPEAKQRIVAALTGRPCSAETREKIAAVQRGRTHTPERIEQMRLKKTGQKHSDETRQRMSEAHKERWAKRKGVILPSVFVLERIAMPVSLPLA